VKDPAIKESDLFFGNLASLIQPYARDFLGKDIGERSPSLVSLSLSEGEEDAFPSPPPDDKTLGDYLQIWRRGHIKVIRFFGPGTAAVALENRGLEALPTNLDNVDLACSPNSILVFRTACYNFCCRCPEEILTVSSCFLSPAQELVLGEFSGDMRELSGLGDGPPGPPGESVNVVNTATRLMACWDDPDGYGAGLFSATDAGVHIPVTRWNVTAYYEPDDRMVQPWQTATVHQSLV